MTSSALVNSSDALSYARLVTSPDQVVENAVRFQQVMQGNDTAAKAALISTIPYFRSWVAVPNGTEFILAPSKWVGYVNMQPEFYSAHHHDELDGRETERVMRPWLQPVGTDHPLWHELHDLCARYGKKPNRAARIAILTETTTSSDTIRVAELLVATFQILPPDQQRYVRNQLGRA